LYDFLQDFRCFFYVYAPNYILDFNKKTTNRLLAKKKQHKSERMFPFRKQHKQNINNYIHCGSHCENIWVHAWDEFTRSCQW